MPHAAKIIRRYAVKIERNYYLNQLIDRKDNGFIKIVTGLRRCGKSFLLFELYFDYLLDIGVSEKHIIRLPLDEARNARYRNPLELDKYLRNKIKDKKEKYYIFLDEVQFVKDIENPWLEGSGETIGFVDVLLGLMKIKNVDIYITGSNSKMLSSEVVTQFRDRGDEVRVYPFTYSEVCRALGGDSEKAWKEFYTYGGMPRVLQFSDRKSKIDYLTKLFENTYIRDVLERYDIKAVKSVLDDLLRIISSAVGSLSNPKKISDTFRSELGISTNSVTVDRYLDYFIDAFLLRKVQRYDVKGRKYIGTPMKYYFADLGIRNALLEFRQQEENHIMENIIYNELIVRGFSVDVGMVEYRHRNEEGKDVRTQLEVDFIAKSGDKQIYIQSALNIDTHEKRQQEIASLTKIPDSFKKIVIVKDSIVPWIDDNGINYVGIREFLSGNYPDIVFI